MGIGLNRRQCGCSAYLISHDSCCPDTPIYAQLVDERGNPADTWPYIVFNLIGFSSKESRA